MDKRRPRAKELGGFSAWLGDYGLDGGTIRLYVHDVKRAYAQGGPLRRLRDRELAPKTLRHIKAACRGFARFRGDDGLLTELDKIRLPAPIRKTAKVPLAREELFALVDEIDRADYLDEAMRAELGLMASRGFRCGDVLRLKRREVKAALRQGTLAYEAKGRRRLEFKVLGTFRPYLDLLVSHPRWERVEDLISPRAAEATRRQAAGRAAARALGLCGANVGIEGLYPHRLRRTYAVEYLRALGPDPFAAIKLQQHMQWASLQTAMGYVDHDRGSELDDVAESMWQRES
ncbi:MAG: tyrosine-type recombinase/integrase [Deltaproteobacteria bacterium]|nr:tyrosine-type recombinase/integrase [Deltaproteobacteria bacterium]